MGGVCTPASEDNVKLLRYAHHHTLFRGDRINGIGWIDVQSISLSDRKLIEYTGRYHLLCPTEPLFCRLKEKEDIPLQPFRNNILDQPDQGGNVDIMPASVHKTWMFGPEVTLCLLLERQAVHIGPEKKIVALSPGIFCQQAGKGKGMDLQPLHIAQHFPDILCRLLLPEGEFRYSMQILPYLV